jgi:FMN phosphatase YigB (HAD superfamily)
MPVVMFDLDNTLLDREAAFARWAHTFCQAHGLPDDAHDWLIAADDDGFRPREEVFAAVRARYAVADPVEDLVHAYHRDYPTTFVFPADSRNALRRLRSVGWKVAVVTNGLKFQEQKLAVTQLGDEVDAVCVSALVDSWKPDRRIFEEAARRCGVDLEGWMVGDSGPADIRGGQGAGLRTIWIHRGRTWDLGGPEPDAQASDVPAAVRLILGVEAAD